MLKNSNKECPIMNKVTDPWSLPLKSSSPRPPGDGEEQVQLRVIEQLCEKMSVFSDEKLKPDNKSVFQPDDKEGSSSPSNTPSYIKWTEGLHHLLNDACGIELFQQYLEQEGCGRNELDFWLACNGMTKAHDVEKNLLRIIYKTLVMNLIEISPQTKKEIADKLESGNDLNNHLFDKAWAEVEKAMEKTTYPSFLQSDLYIQYVQAVEEGNVDKECVSNETFPETGEFKYENSDSKSAHLTKIKTEPKEDILPTLYEDRPFEYDCNGRSLTRALLRKRAEYVSCKTRPEWEAGHYLKANTPGYNTSYHVKYASYLPPSAQDSELQSLSSDAHTDTDKSHTDLSTIGCSPEPRITRKKYEHRHKSSKQEIYPLNKGDCAIELMPPKPRVDEKKQLKGIDANDAKFIKELQMKLLDVKKQQEQDEFLQEPQSILDAHVSKFIKSWPGSAQQTPGSNTPPPPPSYYDMNNRQSYEGLMNSQAHNAPYYYNHCNKPQYAQQESMRQHREPDAYSCDSGTVRDYSSDVASSVMSNPGYAQSNMSSEQRRRFKEQVKRYAGKKPSHWESQSTFDSGIGLTNVPYPNETLQQNKKSSNNTTSNYPRSQWNSSQQPGNNMFEGAAVMQSYGFTMYSAKSPLAQDHNVPMMSVPSNDGAMDDVRHLPGGSYQRPKSNRSMPSRERNVFENVKSRTFSSEESVQHNRKSGRKSYPMMTNNFVPSTVETVKPDTKIAVAYCFGNGTVPYLSKLYGKDITLRQFKTLISKKGNFKYFFKKKNEDFGIVLEEVTEDNEILPLFEGKIFSVIETIDEVK